MKDNAEEGTPREVGKTSVPKREQNPIFSENTITE